MIWGGNGRDLVWAWKKKASLMCKKKWKLTRMHHLREGWPEVRNTYGKVGVRLLHRTRLYEIKWKVYDSVATVQFSSVQTLIMLNLELNLRFGSVVVRTLNWTLKSYKLSYTL
jgi:hypothetical protein